MQESKTRSLLKATIWRLVAVCIAFLIAYLIFEKPAASLLAAVTINGINFVLYYIHERIWDKIDFGRTYERVENDSV